MRQLELLLAFSLFVLTTGSASAEWKYLAPNGGDNVHRAFTFAEKSDDRLEFACNTKRLDFFYVAAKNVSKRDFDNIKRGKPTTLVRVKGVGLAAINAQTVYRQGKKLIFVTLIQPRFLTDLGKWRVSFVAGMKANGKIVRQGLFPSGGLQAVMKKLADGCKF